MSQDTIQAIPLAKIISRPQVRREFDQTALAELARSIKEVGVQQPIQVRPEGDQFVIVFGERRWRAAKLAGLTTIPAIVVDREVSESELLQTQLIENIQRADLSAREKSVAIQRLMSTSNLTAAQVASKLGLSAANVTKLLSLAGLPEPILAGVDAGKISLTAAYELSQIGDLKKQNELAALSAGGQLTRDALVAAKKASKRSVRANIGESKPAHGRVTAVLDSERSITLAGADLSSLERLIEWLEELLGKARKARPQGLSLPTFVRMLKEQAHL